MTRSAKPLRNLASEDFHEVHLFGIECPERHGTPPHFTAAHRASADGEEGCDIRDHLLAAGRDCRKWCGLNTSASPMAKAKAANA